MELIPKKIVNLEINYWPTSNLAQKAFIIFLNNEGAKLSDKELILFAQQCERIANASIRAWEASDNFIKVSSELLNNYDFETLIKISNIAYSLCLQSPIIAASFVKECPKLLNTIEVNEIEYFHNILKRLSSSGWKEIALAKVFLEKSPEILKLIHLKQMKIIISILTNLSDKSHELTVKNIEKLPIALLSIAPSSRVHFLKLINELSIISWPDVGSNIEKLPQLLRPYSKNVVKELIVVGGQVLKKDGRKDYEEYLLALGGLVYIDPSYHSWLIKSVVSINQHSSKAAVAFMSIMPKLLSLYSKKDLTKWINEGIEYLLKYSQEPDDTSYFKLESNYSIKFLYENSSVELISRKKLILEKYCQALAGRHLAILDIDALVAQNIGWLPDSIASTDGSSIYLPARINIFESKEKNFQVYKVYATHQASRIEFGSFDYKFIMSQQIIDSNDITDESERSDDYSTEIQKFFSYFSDKDLISNLFSIVEDFRIDGRTNLQYPGISLAKKMVKKYELSKRNNLFLLPNREMLIESLICFSLGKKNLFTTEHSYQSVYISLVDLLTSLLTLNSTVNDSANVASEIYHVLINIPNILEFDGSKNQNEKISIQNSSAIMPTNNSDNDSNDLSNELDFQAPQKPEYQGDFKPDLIELITNAKNKNDTFDNQASGMDQEMLNNFLQETTEINVDQLAEGEFEQFSNLFSNNINLFNDENASVQNTDNRETDVVDKNDLNYVSIGKSKMNSYYYDEWNFRTRDYKPDWCKVIEKELEPGESDYYDQVILEHSKLISETKRKFEYLKPEAMKKEKRLEDGDEIDLDRLVDFFADKLAGYSPRADFYWKRNKIERDVSVALLLDMSASTDEIIEKDSTNLPQYNNYSGAPGTYFTWLASRNLANNPVNHKRIIDIEKESTIVLSEALDAIGDNYGLYGFSGYGKDNVEFFVIKDIEEPLDEDIRRKIAGIQPVRSTRMGPAIRHTIKKLEVTQSKIKIIILISDGRPQDHEYGKDRTEKEYAIHDTRQALLEAKHKGITPFLITVDKEGHDYLQQMCDDIGYEIVSNIDSLPVRLTNLYKNISLK
ncbi:MAG: hypothetical protein P8J51_04880 [Dehalococcoidia bacterium]|nr:hypothetical protein [Dehalococcoidia bacterium]